MLKHSILSVAGAIASRFLIGCLAIYEATSLLLGGTRAAPLVFRCLAATWGLAVIQSTRGRCSLDAGWLSIRTRRWMFRLVAVIALTIAATELALRVVFAVQGLSAGVCTALDSVRLLPGHDYGAGLRGNQLGYPESGFARDRKPESFRLAVLGDSFAIGPTVPFADNYVTRLGDQTGWEVLNFAVSGAGPREYLTILRQDVWRFQPDLVLVSIFVTNDVTELLATPRYLDLRQHCLYWLWCRLWSAPPSTNPGIDPGPGRLHSGSLSLEDYRQLAARRLVVCRTDPVKGLEKKWQTALSYLEQLVTDCRSRGILVAFLLIPDEVQVNPDVLTDLYTAGCVGWDELDLDLPQRRFGAFCEQRGVPYLDLLPHLRGRTDLYTPRNTHWNVTGNHLAAQITASWLKSLHAGSFRERAARVSLPVCEPPRPTR